MRGGFWRLEARAGKGGEGRALQSAAEAAVECMLLGSTLRRALGAVEQESRGGPRWERLRGSVPLWMQLLMVLLFTWLWVQPHWLERSAVQRVGVVLGRRTRGKEGGRVG